jgi:hypothetical protein
MPDSFIHYRSYSRGWRPLCDAKWVPETGRGTLAVRDVTCRNCLEAMAGETQGREVAGSGAGDSSPNTTPERAGP